MNPRSPFDPVTLREHLHHKAELWRERHGDSPASAPQARFVASMWGSAFEGDTNTRKQAYHSCLNWLWRAESANNLTKAEASVTLTWLLLTNDQDEQIPDEEGNPQLDPVSAEETRRVLKEAMKEKGQMELL